MPTIKLNFFQRLMQRWSQHLAYNAIHVMHIAGNPELTNWQNAILTTLQKTGLGFPNVDQAGNAQFRPLETLSIATPKLSLDDYLQQELNYRFSQHECPLRFFIISENNTYYLGITYNHWLADAYAIRKLLQQMINRYYQTTITESLTLHAPEFEKLFRPHLGRSPKTLWLREMLRGIQLFFRAHRLALKDKKDFTSQYILQTIPTNTLENVKHYCREKSVSMNDVFIATLGQIMGKITATARQKKSTRRNHIAISTIADIRHNANQSLAHVVGQYLSSYTVVLSAPEQQPIEKVITTVNRSTSRIKNSSRMVRSHYNFAAAVRLWDQNPKRRAQLFYKYAPICAGISNIQVRDEWSNTAVLDYWRVSPTGPLTPVVFSLTTFRDKLTVCLAYRTSALSEEVAREVAELFCRKLATLKEGA